MQWVMTSSPAVRTDATSALVSRWARTDSSAASDWVQKLSETSQRDVALQGLALQLRFADPAGARQLAEQINDALKRENGIEGDTINQMDSGWLFPAAKLFVI